MPQISRLAAIQMNTGDEVLRNLAAARRLLEQARDAGAQLAVLPENFAFMGAHERDKLAHAEADGDGPIQAFLAETAAQLGLWLVAGTVPLAVPGDADRVFAACLVYDEHGRRRARYDKIHLFDVDVPGAAERYRESASIAHGAPDAAAVVQTPAGTLGLSICYDLRFPELYRRLAALGAEVLLVPSAFTERTGRAHWALLLRARAIENQCYVVAPNQCGTHPGGRRTWGRSMIVDPWGTVLAEAGEAPGAITAELDRLHLASLRQNFPALAHRRIS